VVLHLGNTASMCALVEARSVASTIGFTAMEGLLMGTRCGALDPGVVLYLMESQRMEPRAVEKLLSQQSGLLGVSGVSSDMRTLLASPHPEARLAVDLYLYRIRRELGALAGVMGGVDALVFTGGVGANSAAIRARICADAAWLGVQLDANANDRDAALVTAPRSNVRAWRMRSDEEGVIARHTQRLTAREPVAAGHA
jgi:acetate kinase